MESKKFLFNVLKLLFIIMFTCQGNSEVFTALADVEYLVETEKDLTHALQKYLDTETNRLDALKKFLQRVENTLNEVNKTSVGKYIGNPINTYLMLKRFSVDWNKMENMVSEDLAEDVLASIESAKPSFPTVEDYKGAMTAIFRLQDTYHLSSHDLADGKVPGAPRSSPLSLGDIYDLGRHAYMSSDWFHTKGWMEEALRRLGTQVAVENIRRFDILDHLSIAEYNRGNVKKSLVLTEEMVRLNPHDERVRENLHFYRDELRSMYQTGARGDTGKVGSVQSTAKKTFRARTSTKRQWEERAGYLNYEKLCRFEIRRLTRKEQQKMHCWYQQSGPTQIIKPFKVERVWVHPEILIYKNILTETEMKTIRELAYPRLQRATIQDPITGKLRHADYRISKSAWLRTEVDPIIGAVDAKVEDATGLTMTTAEDLQVANYGIGGHYEPHFDFARDGEDKFSDLGTGNRIATMLFYMSDVDAGGATVFTYAETAVKPSKGDGVFWYNLKRNGDGDFITRHAACPVLAGAKWVANKWIHEYGQEFRRKCALNRDL